MVHILLSVFFWFSVTHAMDVRVRIFSVPTTGIEIMGDTVQVTDGGAVPVSGAPLIQTVKISFADIFGAQWKIERNENLRVITDSYLKVVGKNMRVNLNRTPRKILLRPNESGAIDVIAVMNLEEYLKGVLPHEMPASWPEEALKAQVIAARSYAVSQIHSRFSRPYQLDSTIEDQVFRFQDARVEHYERRISKIVGETTGEVLKNGDGSVMRAYYHADCGGRTEQAHAVWDNGDKNPIVKDDHCLLNGSDQWTLNISVRDIEKKLRMKNVTEVKTYVRSGSGRVQSIIVKDKQNESIILTGQELRSKLGFKKLKSTLFDIQIKDKMVQFIGRGFGHGVGLCQVGSRALASKGMDHVAILKHYFPEAQLGKL